MEGGVSPNPLSLGLGETILELVLMVFLPVGQ